MISLAFLGFGLVRIGVGAAMTGQAMGWWSVGGEMAEALADTQRFIGERSVNLAGFSPSTYLAYIAAMGVVLSAGAAARLFGRRWGLAMIALYLAMHAALFVNFWTINPKIAWLAGGIGLWLILWWLGRSSGTTPRTGRVA